MIPEEINTGGGNNTNEPLSQEQPENTNTEEKPQEKKDEKTKVEEVKEVNIFQGDNKKSESKAQEIEGVDADDVDNIKKVLAPDLESQRAENAQTRAMLGVSKFLSDEKNKHFSEFEQQAEEILSDPDNRLAVPAVFYALAGMSGKLEAVIAKQVREADEKARRTATGAETARPTDAQQGKNPSNMSKEEWDKFREAELQRASQQQGY